MEVTPEIAGDRQLIQSYWPGGFTVTGERYQGSIIVFPDRTESWRAREHAALTVEDFEPLRHSGIDILVLGSGPRFELFPPALRRDIREWGIVVEPMATPAACRTYNILLAEERNIAAALLAMPETA